MASPLYFNGHLYFTEGAGGVHRVTADKGGKVYQQSLGSRDRIYASPLAADGKLYFVTREAGVFVALAGPKFKVLAHNVIEDKSICNASMAVANNQLLLRSDRYLYRIGENR